MNITTQNDGRTYYTGGDIFIDIKNEPNYYMTIASVIVKQLLSLLNHSTQKQMFLK